MEGTPEMEEIMGQVKPYLKEGTHNYNSTWNSIQNWKDKQVSKEKIALLTTFKKGLQMNKNDTVLVNMVLKEVNEMVKELEAPR